MRLRKFILPIALVISSMVLSQEFSKSQGDYIVIDVSNSHPTNRPHDRIYYLNLNSASVDLPWEAIEFLELIPDENDDFHFKLTYQRSEILKILYNERINPEDKKFICEFYLNQQDSPGINPLRAVLQKYLQEGIILLEK